MHTNGTNYLADMYIVHNGDHCLLSYLNKFALHVLGGGSCSYVPELCSNYRTIFDIVVMFRCN